MTKPTQAQIEAAAKAIDPEAWEHVDGNTPNRHGVAMQYAEAALTAAAQVGDKGLRTPQDKNPVVTDVRKGASNVDPPTRGVAGPTSAAAQVVVDYNIDDAPEATIVRLATIDRCAKVAEDWGLGRVNQTVKDYPATCAAAIAYAIRKLKDEA